MAPTASSARLSQKQSYAPPPLRTRAEGPRLDEHASGTALRLIFYKALCINGRLTTHIYSHFHTTYRLTAAAFKPKFHVDNTSDLTYASFRGFQRLTKKDAPGRRPAGLLLTGVSAVLRHWRCCLYPRLTIAAAGNLHRAGLAHTSPSEDRGGGQVLKGGSSAERLQSCSPQDISSGSVKADCRKSRTSSSSGDALRSNARAAPPLTTSCASDLGRPRESQRLGAPFAAFPRLRPSM